MYPYPTHALIVSIHRVCRPLSAGQCKTADCRLRGPATWSKEKRLWLQASKTQGWVKNEEWGLQIFYHLCSLWPQITRWCQFKNTRFPVQAGSKYSTLHVPQKLQWTSKQLKSAYIDLQYFHRMSSKFPAEYLSLLLELFTPFSRHYSNRYSILGQQFLFKRKHCSVCSFCVGSQNSGIFEGIQRSLFKV